MNMERIYLLLMVVKEASGHPKLRAIVEEAMAELGAIAAGPREDEEERPAPVIESLGDKLKEQLNKGDDNDGA